MGELREGVRAEATEEMWEGVATAVMSAIVQADDRLYRDVMSSVDPVTRATLEAGMERHAARMRAKGERGW